MYTLIADSPGSLFLFSSGFNSVLANLFWDYISDFFIYFSFAWTILSFPSAAICFLISDFFLFICVIFCRYFYSSLFKSYYAFCLRLWKRLSLSYVNTSSRFSSSFLPGWCERKLCSTLSVPSKFSSFLFSASISSSN